MGDIEGDHADPAESGSDPLEAGHTLELVWPALVTDSRDPDAYVLDIVNTGVRRYTPGPDEAFYVVATVVPAGSSATGIGWATLAQPRALPLDPGEYARVPVTISSGVWRALQPGAHDVHALLVGSALHAPALRVELSADRLRQRHDEVPQPNLERRRRLLEEEVARLSALLEAGPALKTLVDEISRMPTEAEAVVAIARHLAVDETAARSIFAAPLRDLHASGTSRLRDAVNRALQRLDEPQ